MFSKDIILYNNFNFLPLYSIDKLQIIAVSELNFEIIKYAQTKYQQFRFIYYSHSEINKLLYQRIYKDYYNNYSACGVKKNFLYVCFIVITFFIITKSLLLTLNICYLIAILFKIVMTIAGIASGKGSDRKVDYGCHTSLPIYTILVPIKNEKEKTVQSIIKSLAQLDYPLEKLDVKLIVEEENYHMVSNINNNLFDVIKVPYSFPQTKGKACNYALNFTQGEYVTVYDADDKPDKLQLQKVLGIFQSELDLACVQMPLNYYNHSDNYLTRCFALEYSSLFDFVLPGANKLRMPILLGGSSNHFRMNVLQKLQGWDPYNVTEDADLGIKLYRHGYKVHVCSDTETWEEAPVKIGSWLKQRARWIKGYVITYCVHMSKPKKLLVEVGFWPFVFLQLFMMVPVVIYFLSPLLWLNIFINSEALNYFAVFNLILYLCSSLMTSLLSIYKRKWWYLVPYALLMPIYNAACSIASYRAMWQLVTRPYQWDKTEHDQTKT